MGGGIASAMTYREGYLIRDKMELLCLLNK